MATLALNSGIAVTLSQKACPISLVSISTAFKGRLVLALVVARAVGR